MTTATNHTTYHSIDRAKERAGLNERKATKMIEHALERGKSASDFSSMEKNFLESGGHNGCTAIAYNNFCYIVNENGICVTLYPLPTWFGKKKHFNGKEPIRNYKKYCKINIQQYESFALAQGVAMKVTDKKFLILKYNYKIS